jgi:hypothetical protein
MCSTVRHRLPKWPLCQGEILQLCGRGKYRSLFRVRTKQKARAVPVKTAETGVKDTLSENPADITIPRC